jgi:hypothetical protein
VVRCHGVQDVAQRSDLQWRVVGYRDGATAIPLGAQLDMTAFLTNEFISQSLQTPRKLAASKISRQFHDENNAPGSSGTSSRAAASDDVSGRSEAFDGEKSRAPSGVARHTPLETASTNPRLA